MLFAVGTAARTDKGERSYRKRGEHLLGIDSGYCKGRNHGLSRGKIFHGGIEKAMQDHGQTQIVGANLHPHLASLLHLLKRSLLMNTSGMKKVQITSDQLMYLEVREFHDNTYVLDFQLCVWYDKAIGSSAASVAMATPLSRMLKKITNLVG